MEDTTIDYKEFCNIPYYLLRGCIRCKPYRWDLIKKHPGIKIILGDDNPSDSRKREIEQFFLKKGIDAVTWE